MSAETFGERIKRELLGRYPPAEAQPVERTEEQQRRDAANAELRGVIDRARSRNRVVRNLW